MPSTAKNALLDMSTSDTTFMFRKAVMRQTRKLKAMISTSPKARSRTISLWSRLPNTRYENQPRKATMASSEGTASAAQNPAVRRRKLRNWPACR